MFINYLVLKFAVDPDTLEALVEFHEGNCFTIEQALVAMGYTETGATDEWGKRW